MPCGNQNAPMGERVPLFKELLSGGDVEPDECSWLRVRVGVCGLAGRPCEMPERVGEWQAEEEAEAWPTPKKLRSRSRAAIRMGERLGDSVSPPLWAPPARSRTGLFGGLGAVRLGCVYGLSTVVMCRLLFALVGLAAPSRFE